MLAPIGAEVGITYDTPEVVYEGDYLQTSSGRSYLITFVRVQHHGENAGTRKHLRAVVVPKDGIEPQATVHALCWYKRG